LESKCIEPLLIRTSVAKRGVFTGSRGDSDTSTELQIVDIHHPSQSLLVSDHRGGEGLGLEVEEGRAVSLSVRFVEQLLWASERVGDI
jgi:hypothetical protein